MTNYIDKKDAIENFMQYTWYDCDGYEIDDSDFKRKNLEDMFSSIPAAKVMEVKWISVEDELPDDGVYVLGRYCNNDMAVVCIFERDEDLVFWRAMVDEGWETECDVGPTHWMPLPSTEGCV